MKFVALILLLASAWAADLETVRQEKDPIKRYALALDHASQQISEARKAHLEGQHEAFTAALRQVADGVRLCDETLRATGRNPSKNPRHFKRAELRMREIDRRLKALEEEAGFEDRPAVQKTRAEVSKIHDELLLDIMGRRK